MRRFVKALDVVSVLAALTTGAAFVLSNDLASDAAASVWAGATLWVCMRVLFRDRGSVPSIRGLDEGSADSATIVLASRLAVDDDLRERVHAELGDDARSPAALRGWFTASLRDKRMADFRDEIARESVIRADWERVARAASGRVDWHSIGS